MTLSWLPSELDLNLPVEKIFPTLYIVFDNDFKKSKPKFESLDVVPDMRKLPNSMGYEEGFWHLTSVDETVVKYNRGQKIYIKTGNRIPDFDRAKRLPWCRPIIENASQPEILCWNFKEGSGKIRTYLWLKDYDFVIILEKQSFKGGMLFRVITSFYVAYENKKKDLQSKYERREG